MLQLTACQVDLRKERVERDGETIALSPTEAALLRYLVARPGEELTRPQLLTECWGYRTTNSRTVDTTVKQLRKKIEQDARSPDHVLTVYGVGYRFEPLHTNASQAEPLFGREELLDSIGNHLLGGTRLITLLGPGGIGKTRVAREALARSSALGWFCSLESASDANEVLASVAGSLGVEPKATAVIAGLRSEPRAVLVLDNAEQVHRAVTEAAIAWLDAVPGLVIVVTSRMALGTSRETLLPVPPLDAAAGRELLRSRALDADDERLDDLIAAVDGSPLLLELASHRAGLLGVEPLLRRLDNPLRLLADNDPARPARHRSLMASLDWSYEALTPSAQQAWLAASTFQTPFDLAALDSVLGRDALDDLQQLFDANIVSRAGGGRFVLAAALRLYAVQRVRDSQPGLLERHAAWVLERVDMTPYAALTPRRLELLRRFTPDLRATMHRATSHDHRCMAGVLLQVAGSQQPDDALLLECAESTHPEVRAWSFSQRVQRVVRSAPATALELCDARLANPDPDPFARAKEHHSRALALIWLDQLDACGDELARSEALLGARVGWRLRVHQAALATQQGQLERAAALAAEAERLAGDDLFGRVAIHLRRSSELMQRDAWAEVRPVLIDALQCARRLRNRTYEMSALTRLAECEWHCGEHAASLELLDIVEPIASGEGDDVMALWSRLVRAGVNGELGRPWHLPDVAPGLSGDARHFRALVSMALALRSADGKRFDEAAAVAAAHEHQVTPRMRRAHERMIAARNGAAPLRVLDAWTRAAAAYSANNS